MLDSDYNLPQRIDNAELRQAEVDLLRSNDDYNSINEAGEIFLGDGKNIYRLTPTSTEGLYTVNCEGVLNSDRYDRIMREAPEVFEEDEPFKVLLDFLRSNQAYWDPEKREFLGEDELFFDSDTAQRQVQDVVADGNFDYRAPAERDWTQIVEKLG